MGTIQEIKLFTCLTAVFVAARVCHGQQFQIDWSSIDGGGGTSTGGVYSVSGTIGQPDAGKLSGGNFTLAGGFWGGVSGASPAGAPTLAIQASGGFATISWSPTAPGYVLQSSDSLASAVWTNAPSGSSNPVIVPASGSSRFFRLKTP